LSVAFNCEQPVIYVICSCRYHQVQIEQTETNVVPVVWHQQIRLQASQEMMSVGGGGGGGGGGNNSSLPLMAAEAQNSCDTILPENRLSWGEEKSRKVIELGDASSPSLYNAQSSEENNLSRQQLQQESSSSVAAAAASR
jgi:hypothetical protein